MHPNISDHYATPIIALTSNNVGLGPYKFLRGRFREIPQVLKEYWRFLESSCTVFMGKNP